MVRNAGEMDRTIRVQIGGALALITALAWAAHVNLVWLGAIAGVLMLTGFAGFCPAYTLLGINTCEDKK